MENSGVKNFSVLTLDGKRVIIEARNAHDALTIARNEIGQLPNDINTKIVKNLTADINTTISLLANTCSQIKEKGRELDWEKVYKEIKELSSILSEKSETYSQMDGSMVKVRKDNNGV